MARPKSDDDRIPFTLRIPADLHEDLLRYATDSSLNAEILRRLRFTIQMDMVGQEMEKPELQPAKARVSIQLDSGGRLLTWDEIRDRVAAAVSGLGQPIGNVSIEIISAKVELGAPAEAPKVHDAKGGLEGFRQAHAEGESPLVALVKAHAPHEMSLKRLFERIGAGEEAEEAFFSELGRYLAGHGVTRLREARAKTKGARFREYEEGQRVTAKALARLEEMEALLRERAPPNMSLNRLMDRVVAGEDPVAAFEDELRQYLAEHPGDRAKEAARHSIGPNDD